jgi:NTP pyrophosphatase (non-canonical NTP hydrolase)
MIDWEKLSKHVIGYRDSKGFAATTWDTAPARLNCLHSEIYELEEALASGTDWDVRHELADIVMYALTLMHDLSDQPSWSLRTSFHGGASKHGSPAELTSPLRKYARAAFEAWRKGQIKDVLINVEILIVAVVDMRVRVLGLPGDITVDVKSKIQASSDRPRCHNKDARS